MLPGYDESGWQHDDPSHPEIDFHAAYASGMRFGWVKGTQGGDYVSPWLRDDVVAEGEARILAGAYHFAVPGAMKPDDVEGDAVAQARFALSAAHGLDLPLGLACDLEEMGPFQWFQLSQWFQAFAREVNLTGMACPLYCDRYYLANMTGAPWGWRLWLALGEGDPDDYPEGVKPWMVQTTPAPVDGFAGPVDRDFLLVPRGVNPSRPVAPKPPAASVADTGEWV